MAESINPAQGFAVIPNELARNGGLSAMAKAVYLVLASYANRDLECWPSIATIARCAAVSPTTARKLLGELRDKNLITWVQRRDDDGDPASNLYRLGGTSPAGVPSSAADRGVPQQLVTNNTQVNNGPPVSPEVTQLCELLASLMVKNGAKAPTVGKRWHDAARLLLERDGRTLQEASTVLRWCQADAFWRANILSMPKFREKYDQLKLSAEREGVVTQPRPSQQPQVDNSARDRWLRERGVTPEEYERRKGETGWLESLRAVTSV